MIAAYTAIRERRAIELIKVAPVVLRVE